MDKLVPDILSRLAGDTELTTTKAATVYGDRQPDDPSTLKTPVVVVSIAAFPEAPDRHGGATFPLIEIDVWGYETFDRSQFGPCIAVGQRIDEIMILPYSPTDGGKTSRFTANTGWQRIDEPDPRVVHLNNRYECLYWQTQRLVARTS